ncbi:MAG: outer membrane protein assembly factor BamA [Planctomycetota bacterium]
MASSTGPALLLASALLVSAGAAGAVRAQVGELVGEPFEGSPITSIRFEGLGRVDETLARNQLRAAPGRPLEWETVRGDLRRLERLGEFSSLRAELEPLEGGSVVLIYVVEEAAIVRDVVVVGNRQIDDDQISEVVRENVVLLTGVPIDEFRIRQSQRAIEDLYRASGYYQARVEVDEGELAESGIVIFRVREGERVRVTGIRFEGNEAFSARRLQTNVNLRRTGVFQTGALDDELVARDIAALREFYQDAGYLDARVDRRLTLSADNREVIVTFVVAEGPQFIVRELLVYRAGAPLDEAGGGLAIMTPDQVRALAVLKPGAVATGPGVDQTRDAVRDAYHQMGYVDAVAAIEVLRDADQPVVDLLISITESDPRTSTDRHRTGLIIVQGNELTQRRVVQRAIDLEPDRWLDASQIDETQRRLRQRRLFDPRGTRVTIQDEDPSRPGYRDVLIEVQETNTGLLQFGASVNSDAGLVGNISLSQSNFDIGDTPDSFSELFRGRAFRGGGQQFNLQIAPGTELSNYSISLTEPALFETAWSGSGSVFFRQRDFDDFDEERLGGTIGLGRNFGTRWRGSVLLEAQNIDIQDGGSDPLQDFADVEGENVLTEVGVALARTTVDNRFRPTRGTRSEFRVTQGGAIGGDFDYTRLEAEHTLFVPLTEDELGRRTTLRLNGRIGWVPDDDELPIFERFYLGGRSFRGFDFRGIGPTGVRVSGAPSEDQVGGSFLFFAGAQVQRPVFRDIVAVVAFIDSGTIASDFELDEYRVSAGGGLRLYLPQFGQAPLAFDFAVPLSSEETDEEQLFSFSLDLPF